MNKQKVLAGDWRPNKWSDFAGNSQIKEYWKETLTKMKLQKVYRGDNALMIGESGSGKTSTTEYGLKCLGCLNFNSPSLDACGECEACKDLYHRYGHGDWRYFINWIEGEARTPIRLDTLIVDCPNLTLAELANILHSLQDGDNFLQVVVLDEIQTLVSKNMDEKLLLAMEQYPATWIAMSACLEDQPKRKKLEQMLINRFTYILPTEKPTMEEFMTWCVDRCIEFGIAVDTPADTLELLATRTERVMRRARQVLVRAQNSLDKVLTQGLVQKHFFLS